MKSKENHLPDGRHVAAVGTDELYYLWRHGLVDDHLYQSAVADPSRPPALSRRPAKGYIPFSGGSHGDSRVVSSASAPREVHKPAQPTNVKDAKKDRKKNQES